MSDEKIILTHSLLQSFKDCRRKAKLRYVDGLQALERERPLRIGGVFHRGLELLREHGIEEIIGVSRLLSGPDRILVRVMLESYAQHWADDGLVDVAVERVFDGPITNPRTGAVSRKCVLAGKIDRIVRDRSGRIWLKESKTASTMENGYLEKLWTDSQTLYYVHAARRFLGIEVVGVIYDISLKCGLEQRTEESVEDFEARKLTLKEPKRAKRRTAETDSAFEARVREWYASRPAFHREELLISKDRLEDLEHELWDLHLAYLEALRTGRFYQNTGHCFLWNRRCSYFPICRSSGNPSVIQNFYEHVPPHEELREEPVEAF